MTRLHLRRAAVGLVRLAAVNPPALGEASLRDTEQQ